MLKYAILAEEYQRFLPNYSIRGCFQSVLASNTVQTHFSPFISRLTFCGLIIQRICLGFTYVIVAYVSIYSLAYNKI
jgi:hypothetical protein